MRGMKGRGDRGLRHKVGTKEAYGVNEKRGRITGGRRVEHL